MSQQVKYKCFKKKWVGGAPECARLHLKSSLGICCFFASIFPSYFPAFLSFHSSFFLFKYFESYHLKVNTMVERDLTAIAFLLFHSLMENFMLSLC